MQVLIMKELKIERKMDIQCFQKDDLNCIKVFVNNIKGYAHN